jgi:hypothetical protein
MAKRLSLDSQLVNRDVATQFKTFIVNPFVEKIGTGGRRWDILLDGLEEPEGEDAQCEIIQLISTFTHNHRDARLIWIIVRNRTYPTRSTTKKYAAIIGWSTFRLTPLKTWSAFYDT